MTDAKTWNVLDKGSYFIRLRNVSEVVVEVEAFSVNGHVGQEKDVIYRPPKPQFMKRGTDSHYNTTYELDEAERIVEGSIKWDGCSNLDMFPDEGGYVHFCSPGSAKELGEILLDLYREAAKMMTHVDYGEEL